MDVVHLDHAEFQSSEKKELDFENPTTRIDAMGHDTGIVLGVERKDDGDADNRQSNVDGTVEIVEQEEIECDQGDEELGDTEADELRRI